MSDIPVVKAPNPAIAYWLNVASHVIVAIGGVLVTDGVVTSGTWQTYGGAAATLIGIVVAVLNTMNTGKAMKALKAERDRLRLRVSRPL